MVAFGFLPQKFGKWQTPMNDTLSFYERRFSGGQSQTLPYTHQLPGETFNIFGMCL